MPTHSHDKEFAEEMIGYATISPSALDAAIAWISTNLDPENVFDETYLAIWAEKNGYTKE